MMVEFIRISFNLCQYPYYLHPVFSDGLSTSLANIQHPCNGELSSDSSGPVPFLTIAPSMSLCHHNPTNVTFSISSPFPHQFICSAFSSNRGTDIRQHAGRHIRCFRLQLLLFVFPQLLSGSFTTTLLFSTRIAGNTHGQI